MQLAIKCVVFFELQMLSDDNILLAETKIRWMIEVQKNTWG